MEGLGGQRGWIWGHLISVLAWRPGHCPLSSVLIVPSVSLQALPYVCLLIAMLFFIYAIIGMQVGMPPGQRCVGGSDPLGERALITVMK